MHDPTLSSAKIEHMQHLGIAVHDDVRIVRHDDDLTPSLVFLHLPHDQVVDQMIVEIVLGLIEYQWFVAVCEQEGQHRR